MYIISKRKDYYDGVVGTMGIDKTIVYDRETTMFDDDVEFPKEFRYNRPYDHRYKNRFINLSHHSINTKQQQYTAYSAFIVGFCGKLYIGWKLYREEYQSIVTNVVTEITYDYELIKKLVNQKSWVGNLDDDFEYIKTYNSIHIFRDLKSPIFIYDADYKRTIIGKYTYRQKPVFIVNPNLSDYEFYTVMDSFTAFQEVQMFMGGVLGSGEKEIAEVEDKYKISQHGFDKYSFRKDPEK